MIEKKEDKSEQEYVYALCVNATYMPELVIKIHEQEKVRESDYHTYRSIDR